MSGSHAVRRGGSVRFGAQAFRDAQGEVDLATKADLRELEHALRAALTELKADMIKWVAGLLLAQAALVATLVKLL